MFGAGTAAVSYLWVAGPVLVESSLPMRLGSISDPPFVILNPIRDRGPETEAERFLAGLRGPERVVLLVEAGLPIADAERIAVGEAAAPTTDCTRFTRSDDQSGSTLTYFPIRAYDTPGYAPPVLVRVERAGETWRVRGYTGAF
jgi:hypothetical protein